MCVCICGCKECFWYLSGLSSYLEVYKVIICVTSYSHKWMEGETAEYMFLNRKQPLDQDKDVSLWRGFCSSVKFCAAWFKKCSGQIFYSRPQMKGLEQDRPAGLWAAQGFSLQLGWARHLGTQLLEGESASCLELLQRVAEWLAGHSSAGLHIICLEAPLQDIWTHQPLQIDRNKQMHTQTRGAAYCIFPTIFAWKKQMIFYLSGRGDYACLLVIYSSIIPNVWFMFWYYCIKK